MDQNEPPSGTQTWISTKSILGLIFPPESLVCAGRLSQFSPGRKVLNLVQNDQNRGWNGVTQGSHSSPYFSHSEPK